MSLTIRLWDLSANIGFGRFGQKGKSSLEEKETKEGFS